MDDSDHEFNELPDGRLICKKHGLVVCGRCCVDYSYMDEILGREEDAESSTESYEDGSVPDLEDESTPDLDEPSMPSLHRLVRRGTGRVFATRFVPPSPTSTPGDLFCLGYGRVSPGYRFIRRNDPLQLLIYADGACINNGQANPKAGWAFVVAQDRSRQDLIVSGRLENKGPFGDDSNQTSNRAELRAILAALRFRAWSGEGFKTLVLATDSEYVAEGATTWIRRWVSNSWHNGRGEQTKNKDLWEALLGEFENARSRGLNVEFWRIPRALNTTADRAAKEAAENGEPEDRYRDYSGVLC